LLVVSIEMTFDCNISDILSAATTRIFTCDGISTDGL